MERRMPNMARSIRAVHESGQWRGEDVGVPAELAMDIAGLGTVEVDVQGERLSCSQRAAEIWGARAERLGGWEAWLSRVHPEDRDALKELRRGMLARGAAADWSKSFRVIWPDGQERSVSTRWRVYPGADGVAHRIVGVLADETEQRPPEQRSAWLLNELQHRVKNILAIVRSLSKRTLETTTGLEDYVSHFDGRLAALARVQGVIARRLGGGVDVEELVREEFLQHAAEGEDRLLIDGPSVALNGYVAEILGLAIHELAVNSVKFGALSAQRGRLDVSWTLEPDGRFSLRWIEQGVPVLSAAPGRIGFGRQLIEEGLPYQLEAETRFDLAPGGLKCLIVIPHPQESPQ